MRLRTLSVLFFPCLMWGASAEAANYKIKIGSMKFIPNTVTLKVGDKVTWINQDIGVHNVVSKVFNSGTIRPKKKWTTQMTEAGEFPYKCVFHTGMKGQIIVKGD